MRTIRTRGGERMLRAWSAACGPNAVNSEPETRNLKPETRSPKPETRNPKPETRKLKAGVEGFVDVLEPTVKAVLQATSAAPRTLVLQATSAEPRTLKPENHTLTLDPQP